MYKLTALALLLSFSALTGDDRKNNLWVGIDDDVLPQVADGSYWKTTVTLVNMDTSPAQYKLSFLSDEGLPMPLDFVGRPRASVITGTLPVNGSVVIETTGLSETLSQGFAILERPDYKEVNGYGMFRQKVPSQTQEYEAIVPFSSEYDDDFILPFDNTTGYTTAMAIANPSDWSDELVTVAFYDQDGVRFHLDQFTLKPLKHEAYALGIKWPITDGKKGTAVFQVSPWGAPVLGMRFNWTGPFTSAHTLSR